MRFGTSSVLFLIGLLAIPVASAQAPQTTSSLTITGLPAQVDGLASNATITVPFTVEYRATNTLCPQPAEVRVTATLNAANAPAFITTSLAPQEGVIPVTAGPHQTITGSVSFTLHVNLTEVTANASVPIEIAAQATSPGGCQPPVPAATAGPATTFANVTAPPPPPEPTPPVEESPGPGAALVAVVVAVAAIAARRRRKA